MRNMVTEDLRIDELILQVFEDHEDTFFWPVSSQKEAKTFVKFLHEKGAPYEDLCKEIGEFEHNFSAWRKGLGRVGIGSRMIDRINRTVEDVIASDDEEEAEHNLKLLAKVNQKNNAKTNGEKPKPAQSEPKDPKQQKQDIASSMMKNIDKVTTNIIEPKEKTVTKTQPPPAKEPEKPKREIIQNKPEEKKPEIKKQDVTTHKEVKAEPVRQQPQPKKEIVQEKVEVMKTATKVESKPVEEKAKVEHRPEPVKTEKVTETRKETDDEKEDKPKKEDPEVDEVKRKMDAIRKKVELMKKAKAEQAAAAAATNQQPSSGSAETPASQGTEAGEKYEAMKKKLSDLRTKLMEDDSANVVSAPAKKKPDDNDSVQDQNQSPKKKTGAPIVTEENDESSSGESTSSSDLEDDKTEDIPYYDSDLDPENYDSDHESELSKEVKRLATSVNTLRSKVRSSNGPGYLYIFSDSPSKDREHRVKVGTSKCPEKRFAEACRYNIALKNVSSIPVNRRKSALTAVLKSLNSYRIDEECDWFKGPIDSILQKVWGVTEQYGQRTGLTAFDSKC